MRVIADVVTYAYTHQLQFYGPGSEDRVTRNLDEPFLPRSGSYPVPSVHPLWLQVESSVLVQDHSRSTGQNLNAPVPEAGNPGEPPEQPPAPSCLRDQKGPRPELRSHQGALVARLLRPESGQSAG